MAPKEGTKRKDEDHEALASVSLASSKKARKAEHVSPVSRERQVDEVRILGCEVVLEKLEVRYVQSAAAPKQRRVQGGIVGPLVPTERDQYVWLVQSRRCPEKWTRNKDDMGDGVPTDQLSHNHCDCTGGRCKHLWKVRCYSKTGAQTDAANVLLDPHYYYVSDQTARYLLGEKRVLQPKDIVWAALRRLLLTGDAKGFLQRMVDRGLPDTAIIALQRQLLCVVKAFTDKSCAADEGSKKETTKADAQLYADFMKENAELFGQAEETVRKLREILEMISPREAKIREKSDAIRGTSYKKEEEVLPVTLAGPPPDENEIFGALEALGQKEKHAEEKGQEEIIESVKEQVDEGIQSLNEGEPAPWKTVQNLMQLAEKAMVAVRATPNKRMEVEMLKQVQQIMDALEKSPPNLDELESAQLNSFLNLILESLPKTEFNLPVTTRRLLNFMLSVDALRSCKGEEKLLTALVEQPKLLEGSRLSGALEEARCCAVLLHVGNDLNKLADSLGLAMKLKPVQRDAYVSAVLDVATRRWESAVLDVATRQMQPRSGAWRMAMALKILAKENLPLRLRQRAAPLAIDWEKRMRITGFEEAVERDDLKAALDFARDGRWDRVHDLLEAGLRWLADKPKLRAMKSEDHTLPNIIPMLDELSDRMHQGRLKADQAVMVDAMAKKGEEDKESRQDHERACERCVRRSRAAWSLDMEKFRKEAEELLEVLGKRRKKQHLEKESERRKHEEERNVLLAKARFKEQEEMRQVVEQRIRFQREQDARRILDQKAAEEAERLQREKAEKDRADEISRRKSKAKGHFLAVLEPGSHVDTEIDVKVQPYVKPEMLKLCQREGIFASDKHGCLLARSPPMRRGLDLLPDWDRPHIRDEFNFWCAVCKQNLTYWQGVETHLTSSSSAGKHRHFKEKERLIAAADVALKLYEEQLEPQNNVPIVLDPEQRIFDCRPCRLERQPWRELEEHLMKRVLGLTPNCFMNVQNTCGSALRLNGSVSPRRCTSRPCTTRNGRNTGMTICSGTMIHHRLRKVPTTSPVGRLLPRFQELLLPPHQELRWSLEHHLQMLIRSCAILARTRCDSLKRVGP
uniref:Uncharacterized protein n=1 Tax=Noctiluca scintillans TaxID=2966 RepID=A0A7S1AUT0_NOCSC|mmetsp:Transcript_60690/g.161254  ORF Transcript_60690/g.161254 Transcript_60690/m.161254 type:complete len:1087 (+) Transcript_60690:71-3331(+)